MSTIATVLSITPLLLVIPVRGTSVPVSVAHPRAESSVVATRGSFVPTDTLLAKGKEIVSTICAACHTEQPPPKLAPPLAHVAQRYRTTLGGGDSAVARITAWIAAPAKERSLMPSMAIDRFGLMAPLPIPEEMRRAAATYVLSLADSAKGMRHGGAPAHAHRMPR